MDLVYEFNYSDSTGKLSGFLEENAELRNSAISYFSLHKTLSGKYPTYLELNRHFMLFRDNYPNLKVQSIQQTLKLVEKNWKGYFASLKSYYEDKSKWKGKPQPPTPNRKKYTLIYTNQSCRIKKRKLILNKDFSIQLPKNCKVTEFQQVRIKHINDNNFSIGIVYKKEVIDKVPNDNFMSIDLGVVNFASIITNTDDKPILVKGGVLKSIIHTTNKKTKKKKNKKKSFIKRNNKMKDFLHKTSRLIVNSAINRDVSTIVIGSNINWKNQSKMGKKTNMFFCSMAHTTLKKYISYKAELVGIKVFETEESYTSKCDFLNNEPIGPNPLHSLKKKRKKRGLFYSNSRVILNADVNAACNILRKFVVKNSGNKDVFSRLFDMRCLCHPVSISYPGRDI